jgi:hypothetical protein
VSDGGSVSLPEEEWLQEGPYGCVSPVFAEYVSWVSFTVKMEESDDFGSDSFSDAVE